MEAKEADCPRSSPIFRLGHSVPVYHLLTVVNKTQEAVKALLGNSLSSRRNPRTAQAQIIQA